MNRLFCAGMGAVVDVRDVLDGKLRIALRGGKALVAKKFLDGAQVGALLQHVSAKRVAEGVGVQIGREPLGDRNAFDDTADAAGGEAAATMIDQKGGGYAASIGEELVANREVGVERGAGGFSEGHNSFFFAFAADENGFGDAINVLEVDAGELGIADATAVEQLEHEAVAFGEGGGFGHVAVENIINLFHGGNPRQDFRTPGTGDQQRRILLHHSFPGEPAIERSDRSQRSGDGSLAEAALVEMGEKAADAYMVNVVPISGADVGRISGKVLAISSD